MASRQFKPVVWNKFTQTPVRPETAENPVTLVLNMELTKDNSIRTRRSFQSGLNCSTPESHITTHLVSSGRDSDLIMKVGDTLQKAVNVTTAEAVTLSGAEFTDISADGPGFFSTYGGEVYYCQSNDGKHALFSYDGGESVRNLGVPPIFGDYVGTKPEIRSAIDFQGASDFCGYFCQPTGNGTQLPESGMYCCGEADAENGWNANCGYSEETTTVCQSGGNCDDDPLCPTGYNTFLCMPQQGTIGGTYCWHVVASAGENVRGEKILNCAFKVGLYDPKRGTFGRACEPKSVINFGPNRGDYAMYQYHIIADAPVAPEGYGLAVWCSTGQEVLTVKIPGANFHTLILYNEVHGMSEHLTDMMYLEDIIIGGSQTVDCGTVDNGKMCLFKDQATLASSGQYTGQYERPVPSKAMAILPNGVALYLFPREVKGFVDGQTYSSPETDYQLDFGDSLRPGVEYSVGHPEQIGRNTYNQNDTFSPLPSLRGSPMYSLSDGGTTLLFTRQSIYQLAFNGTPQIKDLGGPGAITHKSIHPTSSGTLYVADEGPVWFKGGKAVEILRELGFDGWLDPLTNQQREDIRIGLMEDSKKLIMTFPVPGQSNRYRALMHDIGTDFTSEWWLGAGQQVTPDNMNSTPGSSEKVEYMISHRGDEGYSFYMWIDGTCYRYDATMRAPDGTESSSVTSCVEMWVSENPNLNKHVGEVTLGLGHRTGDVTLRVTTFENPGDISEVREHYVEDKTVSIASKDGQRYATANFQGMQGKYIRIRIEAEDESVELNQVMIDIGYDEDPKTANEENSVRAHNPTPGA